MKQYEILAVVPGIGRIRHLTKAWDEGGAMDRIRAAYPGRDIAFPLIRQRFAFEMEE